MPAHLGPVAARATAAFILTIVAAMIDEATRLRAESQSAEHITTALTDTVGRALDILHNGLGNDQGSTTPSE